VGSQLGPELPLRNAEGVAVQTTAQAISRLQHQGPETFASREMSKTEAADAAAYYDQILFITVHQILFYGAGGKNTSGFFIIVTLAEKFGFQGRLLRKKNLEEHLLPIGHKGCDC
jgi:hypothetical protein